LDNLSINDFMKAGQRFYHFEKGIKTDAFPQIKLSCTSISEDEELPEN